MKTLLLRALLGAICAARVSCKLRTPDGPWLPEKGWGCGGKALGSWGVFECLPGFGGFAGDGSFTGGGG